MEKVVREKKEDKANINKGDTYTNVSSDGVKEEEEYGETCEETKCDVKEEEEYGETCEETKHEVKGEDENSEAASMNEVYESTSEVHHTEISSNNTVSSAEDELRDTKRKVEERAEGKTNLDILLPVIGSSRTRMEVVKEDTGLVDTSITTFFSPITDISDDSKNREDIRIQTEEHNDLGDEGWLEMIQSYKAPEGKVKCSFCDIFPTNMDFHVKTNHKRRKKYSRGFRERSLWTGP